MDSHDQKSAPRLGQECRKTSDFSPGRLITVVCRQGETRGFIEQGHGGNQPIIWQIRTQSQGTLCLFIAYPTLRNDPNKLECPQKSPSRRNSSESLAASRRENLSFRKNINMSDGHVGGDLELRLSLVGTYLLLKFYLHIKLEVTTSLRHFPNVITWNKFSLICF